MKGKDPFLSELDALDDFTGEPEGEDPTRVDLEAPLHEPEISPEVSTEPQSFESGKKLDVVGLAPDIPIQVVAVMGKKEMTIKDLLEMQMGQVIDFNRPPNEAIDLIIAGKVIAKGEMVEIDGKLGIRILKILK